MARKHPTAGDRPAEPRSIVPAAPRSGDLPRSAVTPDGRLIPPTDEERRGQKEAARQLLAELAAIDAEADPASDGDEVWDEVMRRIDEGRSHRPLFGGAGR